MPTNYNFIYDYQECIVIIALLIVSIVTMIIDCRQTLRIKNYPWLHETNIALGPHPKDWDVLVYFAAWIIFLISIAAYCPVIAPWFIGAIIVLELFVISRNKKLGLGL
jgi:hypothetical protein